MWRVVLADYIQNLKPKHVWHKLKNAANSHQSGLMIQMYFFVYFIIFGAEGVFMNRYIYGSFMLVALLSTILLIACENRLKGVMFLSPMSREERIQYIKCGYWMRVGILFLPYVLGNLMFCNMGYMDRVSFLVLAAIMFLYLLGVNSSIDGKREGVHIWFMLSGYIEFAVFYTIYQDGGIKINVQSVGFWICVFFYGMIALFYLIALVWKTKTEYVKMVIQCADFGKEAQR